MSANHSPHVPAAPLRLGIVGCGAIVRETHLPLLAGNPEVDLRILMDKDLRSAELAKKEFRLAATTTTTLDSFRGNVAAAIVAVPPRFHAPVTIELLQMGIDVLCEKPLATNVQDAEKMTAVAERNGRILSVGLMTRFHRNNTVLRALVDSGELGEIQEVVAETGAPLDWTMTSASYYSREATAGGVFFDAGVHLLDRLLWLFGDLSSLEFEDDSYGGVESNAILRGVLSIKGREIPCRLAFSWTHLLNNSIRVVGSAATAEARLGDADTVHIRRKVGDTSVSVAVTVDEPRQSRALGDPFRAQIQDFIGAVRTRRSPFVSAASTIGALKLIENAYSIRKRMAQPWVEATGPV